MSSQICLKWNSFLNNIATSFESLWEEEGLVDVTLASDGQCLTAHKVILSASSPFFKKVFQTNPCQHPVIILQDVHFSELEALLIFIYKGEVNIEQKNLPALLKAAETLQIRGLSGGDIFAKESYKRLIELEQTIATEEEEVCIPEQDETPKKKQRVAKVQNNSILEKALAPRASRNVSVSESSCSDRCSKDADVTHDDKDTLPNPVYHRLEMKIEPFEVTVEDLQKHTEEKDELQRLDTGQADGTQVDETIAGSSKAAVTVIAEARDFWSPRREEIESRVSIDERPELPDHISSEIRNTTNMLEADNNEVETRDDCSESLSFSSDINPGISHSVFPSFTNTHGNSEISDESQVNNTISAKGGAVYPPFPCPFCDRAYTSWGFRRRHIKAVHTISPRLNCKWCLQVLPTHAAWRRHVISSHNLSTSDARNGLLILEEARMVLQIAHPTRLDTLVNIIKQSSQQNNNIRDANYQAD